jgi:hypothetical protein
VADRKEREFQEKATKRNHLLISVIGVIVGTVAILVAFLQLKDVWQTSLAAFGSAILGAGAQGLLSYLSLKREYEELTRSTDLGEALRNAFRFSENAREDCLALGIRRIVCSLSDLQSSIPLSKMIEGASEVYFLGTTMSRTAVLDGLFQSNPNTEFRFIFVDPDGLSPELAAAMQVIHDIEIVNKAAVSENDLMRTASVRQNVKYKKIQFVPTFSAVLALWRNRQEEDPVRGWLQVDCYFLRTRSDARLWMILEADHNKSILFDRYKNVIEGLWNKSDSYDIRNVIRTSVNQDQKTTSH